MKRASSPLIIAALCALPVGLPAGLSAQALDRAQRPADPAAGPFKFPTTRSHTLPNGLRVLIVEDHSLPLVSVRAVFSVDSTFDPPGKEGLYSVTLGSLREGTTSRNPDQIAQASGDIGTAVAPMAFTTTPNRFVPALALMGDMLMHPSFEAAGVEQRRAAQAAAARTVAQRPSNPALTLFISTLYGYDDGYTRSLRANESSVASITREDVSQYYDRYLGPQETTIVIAGDVTNAGALAEVQRVFAGWTRRANVPPAAEAAVPAARPTTIYLQDVPGANAYLYAGSTGPVRTTPDLYSLETLTSITLNRFTQTLREKRSLAYTANLGVTWHRAPRTSEFFGSTIVAAAKVDSALVEWISLLRSVRSGNVSAAELDAARRARVGPLPARIDGPDSLAKRLTEIARDDLPLDFFDRYAARMSATTAADVAAAASKYIDADHLIIVVTGDRKIIEPALRAANIAPIVIVDAKGKVTP